MTSVSYPNAGPTYTYSFDSISRPIGLTDQNHYAAVSSVQYAPSDQMLSLNYFRVSESRTYNTLMQLIGWAKLGLDLTTFFAGFFGACE
jgi:hypothetical protein